MAGRHQMNSSVAAAGHTDTQNCSPIQNAQQTNGHVDFSFRKRFEKIDWRKIGMHKRVVYNFIY